LVGITQKKLNVVVSVRELSLLMGINISAMYIHITNGMPVVKTKQSGEPTKIHVPSAISWLIDEEAKKLVAARERLFAGTNDEKARLTKAQADHRELLVQKLADSLVPLEDVESTIRELFVLLRKSVMDQAGRLSSELANESDRSLVRQILYNEGRQTMDALSDLVVNFCDIEEDAEETERSFERSVTGENGHEENDSSTRGDQKTDTSAPCPGEDKPVEVGGER